MPTPQRGKLIGFGQHRIGVLHHIRHRKVIAQKRRGQTREGQQQQCQLQARRGPRQGQPRRVVGVGTRQRQGGLHERHTQGQNQGQLSKFRDHGLSV